MSRIKLQFVQAFVDRHGRARHYFRRRGRKQIPLPGLPGSDEFMAAYQAALAAMPNPVEIGASKTKPGTVDALVVAYYKTAEWNTLDPETQKTRKRIIEKFRVAHGGKRVALLHGDHIEIMMAGIPNVYGRRHWLKAIRGLLKAAVPTMRKDDPTKGIAMPKLPKSKGHHTWTDDEIQQYRDYWKLGTQQRLVMEFALEAVSRRCEVVRLGPQHVKNGRIRIERAKGSKDVDILLTPELQAACEAMPKVHMTYIVTAYGKPRSVAGLGNDFARWATDAGLPKRCRLHGLKKGGMRRLAEAGNTTHELMGISGHKTLSQVQLYTEDADRKKLADSGMAKKLRAQNENADVSNLTAAPRQTTG
jgi:site-specific recombinase XerC